MNENWNSSSWENVWKKRKVGEYVQTKNKCMQLQHSQVLVVSILCFLWRDSSHRLTSHIKSLSLPPIEKKLKSKSFIITKQPCTSLLFSSSSSAWDWDWERYIHVHHVTSSIFYAPRTESEASRVQVKAADSDCLLVLTLNFFFKW